MSDPEPCRIKQEETEELIDVMMEESEELSEDEENHHVRSEEKTQSKTERRFSVKRKAVNGFTCTQCGMSFKHKCSLKFHKMIHTGEKPYKCSNCGKRFIQSGNLKAHERIHTGEKPYHCIACGKSFTQSSSLRKHRRNYHNLMVESEVLSGDEEKYVKSDDKTQSKTEHFSVKRTAINDLTCTQCGKTFKLKNTLKLHMKIHTGEKPYKCSHCNKRFSDSGNLKTHQRVHTGEKPYHCTDCGKSFTYSSSLRKHRKNIHSSMLRYVRNDDELASSSTAPEIPSSCTDAGFSTEDCISTSSVGTGVDSGRRSVNTERAPIHKEVKTDMASPDPSLWPSHLTDLDRLEIIQRGPSKVDSDFSFPKDKDGHGFNHAQFYRILSNGEKVLRSWLVYSMNKNCVFCFACKLFSSQDANLSGEGFSDWSKLSESLRSHDSSVGHMQSMLKWRELENYLQNNEKTVDHHDQTRLEEEKKRWRDVLARLISITISLASRNLAFRGSSEHLYDSNNGNFLKEVELLALFDPVMENHLSRIKDKSTQYYLGQQTQNELIELISNKILKTIVSRINLAKYYSIILDCTPDSSHNEQISVILRCVTLHPKPEISKYFLGCVDVSETTGSNLSDVIFDRLRELQIPFENCRGQAYDNGANMKGRSQGVQARLLNKNPRALVVPYEAHSVNLAIADAAKASKDAVCYFGYVQKLFTFFAGAKQRWSILLKHVHLTLKSWSDVRWESQLQCITAVRYRVKEIRDALIEVRQTLNDPVAKVEAQALAEEVASFRFLICSFVWFDILTHINQVNKTLHSESMQMDVAVRLIESAKGSLLKYRQSGIADAQSTAKQHCETLNLETELKEKRLRSTKTHFAYETADEPIGDALKKLKVTFFYSVVDSALTSLQERFKIFSLVKDRFGVLLDFGQVQGMSKERLQKYCTEVEKALSLGEADSDIDGQELAQEIINLPQLPPLATALETLSFLHDSRLQELYPNLWIALRIALTLPVASAESSFSKTKLIKTYLHSSMAQERLSGLSIISINSELAKTLSYDELIDDFAARKSRAVPL